MGKIYSTKIETKIGGLVLIAEEDGLIKIELNGLLPEGTEGNSVTKIAETQMKEYFLGKRKEFSVPFKLEGRDFIKKVLLSVMEIPYGTTVSYGYIANRVKKNAQRAVGQSLSANPIPIIIPCHRVIRADSTLGGFGWGSRIKEFLIRLETENL